MKKYRKEDLKANAVSHVFEGILPGKEISHGGMFFLKANDVTHACDNGSRRHVHEDCKLFYFLQGKAVVEVDGVCHQAEIGDIYLIEPGEDHHIVAGEQELPVGIYCHAR